jgi:purine-binding chemotaxis protein CheW
VSNLEEYFENNLSPPGLETGQDSLGDSERVFLEKYLGLDWRKALAAKGLDRPAQAETVMAPRTDAPKPAEDGRPGEDPEKDLMSQPELRLVSFQVQGQTYAVPIMLVQEVLRAVSATKLPGAPDFLAGITNLRGRVTPLVDLRVLFDASGVKDGEDNFIIVCRYRGVQLGLMVRTIDTMHKAPQENIEWDIEAQVGVTAGLIAGLLKVEDRLIKILSVSRLFQHVLRS